MSEPTQDRQAGESKSLMTWQKKLLPWLVVVVTGVLLFFLVATAIQVLSLQRRIQDFPKLELQEADRDLGRAAVALEAYSIQRRFHMAEVILMSRLWAVYLGFVTGMILALVGAAFILGKLSEPVSEFTAKAAGVEGMFKSSSPGLIMTGLGTILMLATIVTPQSIAVHEGPLYLAGAPTAIPVDPKIKEAESILLGRLGKISATNASGTNASGPARKPNE